MRGRYVVALVGASLFTSGVGRRTIAADGDPVPIPASSHIFAPGPRSQGLMGLQVEPSSITDFQGTVALAYLSGTATDGGGQHYELAVDLRLMSGDYVAMDGSTRTGAFAFI